MNFKALHSSRFSIENLSVPFWPPHVTNSRNHEKIEIVLHCNMEREDKKTIQINFFLAPKLFHYLPSSWISVCLSSPYCPLLLWYNFSYVTIKSRFSQRDIWVVEILLLSVRNKQDYWFRRRNEISCAIYIEFAYLWIFHAIFRGFLLNRNALSH